MFYYLYTFTSREIMDDFNLLLRCIDFVLHEAPEKDLVWIVNRVSFMFEMAKEMAE